MGKITSKRETKYSFTEIVISMSLFFTTEVYLKWHSSYGFYISYIILIAVVYYLLLKKSHFNNDSILISFCFVVLFLWSDSHLSLISFIIRPLFAMCIFIPLYNREKYLDLFFNKIYSTLIGLSVFFYILHWGGIDFFSPRYIKALNELKPHDYTAFVFFVVPNSIIESVRFYAYYDEPGVVGTLMGCILFFYRKNLNLVPTIIYIVAGVLSLSIFFFVVLFAYLFLFKWSLKNIIFAIAGIAVMGVVVFSYVDFSFLQENIFDRLFAVEDGKWAGNNRNSDAFNDYFYQRFIHSGEFWTGTTGDVSIAGSSSSMEKLIFVNGFLYTLYGFFLYLFIFFKYKTSWCQFVLYFGMWFGLNYQRPSYDMYFLYIFFITILQNEYYEKRELNLKRPWQRIMPSIKSHN